MDEHKGVPFVMLSIVGVIAIVGLIMMFTGEGVTGEAVKKSRGTRTSIPSISSYDRATFDVYGVLNGKTYLCKDSDKGIDKFVKGTIAAKGTLYNSVYRMNSIRSVSDSCSPDRCIGSNCKLVEMYCGNVTSSDTDVIKQSILTCPNGCSDGKCIPQAAVPPTFSCIDSDGGVIINSTGEATRLDGSNVLSRQGDTCMVSARPNELGLTCAGPNCSIIESYCTGSGIGTTQVSCGGTCLRDKCVETPGVWSSCQRDCIGKPNRLTCSRSCEPLFVISPSEAIWYIDVDGKYVTDSASALNDVKLNGSMNGLGVSFTVEVLSQRFDEGEIVLSRIWDKPYKDITSFDCDQRSIEGSNRQYATSTRETICVKFVKGSQDETVKIRSLENNGGNLSMRFDFI